MNVFLVSLMFTVALFFAHAMPVNRYYIEPNLAKNPKSIVYWSVAFLYYFIIFVCISSLLNI